MYNSTKEQIKRLLMQMTYSKRLEERTSTYRSIEPLLDRLIMEVKREEAEKTSRIFEREREAIRQEVLREEARKMMVEAISRAVQDEIGTLNLESSISRVIANRLNRFLSGRNLTGLIDSRLEELINKIKIGERWESILPSRDEAIEMYKSLPEEILEKMPLRSTINRCRSLVNHPLPSSLEELEKLRLVLREALSELNRWRADNFADLEDLKKIMILEDQRIDEELTKAGFPKIQRKLSNGQQSILYYIPADPFSKNEAEKAEKEIIHKIDSINRKMNEERRRRLEEIRRAELFPSRY